jgi:hypothetical protein
MYKCIPLVVEGKGLWALNGKNAVTTLSYLSILLMLADKISGNRRRASFYFKHVV